MFLSSSLLVLALTTPDAEAESTFRRAMKTALASTMRVTVTVPAGEATSVSADVRSDAGGESVELVESDAWLHGAATIEALPAADATLSLTVYDSRSAAIAAFEGVLGADGTVSFTGPRCADEKCESGPDVDLLAAGVFPNADGGYDVALDLSGADTYEIAYAGLVVTETASSTCDRLTEACSLGGSTTTEAEVAFDEIGAVWEGAFSLAHRGEIEVDATSYDIDGKKLDQSTTHLWPLLSWNEGGYSSANPIHSMLSAGDGGTVALVSRQLQKDGSSTGLVVVSDAWPTTTAPTHASVELEEGETITIPANSYQRAGSLRIELKAITITHMKVAINGGNLTINGSSTLTLNDLAAPVCVNGTCIAAFVNDAGTLDLAVTGYAATAEKVAAGATIALVAYDKAGTEVGSASTKVAFDDAVCVVFVNAIDFAGDPLGLDLGGAVSLLGAEDGRGKQKTLAKGDFYGSFVRTGEADLALGGVDKNDIDAKGDILIGGEPIDFELTDTNKDGVIEAPPVILYKNGTGTRNTSVTSGQSQQAQLL